MDWQRELEARLADDPRLERKRSRFAAGDGFFYKGRELAYFRAPASVTLRLSAATIFALGALTAEECVREVSKDGIVVRLENEQDLDFAQNVLERVYLEKAGVRRPEGKNTRRGGWSAKNKATKALGDAQALKALREFKAEEE